MAYARLLSSIAAALFAGICLAQTSKDVSAGRTFARGVAPSSNGQLVNPSGVDSRAWSSTSIPTSTPTGLGGFSSPISGSTALSQAKSLGLRALGQNAMTACANHVADGSNPARDQECAAVNFLNNNCITPNTSQSAIVGSVGASQTTASNCSGTYGAALSSNDYANNLAWVSTR